LLECNRELAKFITKRIGDGWTTDFLKIRDLAKYANDPDAQNDILDIKRKNKLRFIEYLNRENKMRDSTGAPVSPPPLIDVDTLFDVQIKRIHEYKRQLMNVLYLIMLYHDLSLDPQSHIRRTTIIGGKAAASYETAKDIIRLVYCIARRINRDPAIAGQLKIVYIENYNVSWAEIIIPAADLSEQISTAGTEASGTGNMKLSINGALTIGTHDGANIEMEKEITSQWWPFSFGCTADQIAEMKAKGSYKSRDVYESNPRIKRAVDALRDRSFAQTDEEHQVFSDLYHKLIEMHYGGPPDRYFTLKDLQSYYDTQQKVEEIYRNPRLWAEYVIHNIAGMGKFSSDFSIHNYAKLIWNIQPCPLDQELLDRVRYDYAIHNRCY
jgi:starch phosphorylase